MREVPLDLSLDQTWKISNGETLTTHEIFTKLKRGEIKKMLFCENEVYEEDTIKQRFKIVGDYGLLENLGEGNFGEVYRCYNINHGKENYAIKIPSSSLQKSYESQGISLGQLFSEEAVAVARLSVCENVVAVVDHNTDYPYLVLEYCDEGTLTSLLQKEYSEKDIYNWGMQISAALKVAHSLRPQSLIHRDLKPDNILIGKGVLKIGDFGGAKMRGETSKSMVTIRGGYTPLYASPEAFDGKFNTGVDVWSLGVILYEAVSGKFPFTGMDINGLINNVKNKPFMRLEEFDSLKVKVDRSSVEMIESCLEKEWSKRPTAQEINEFFVKKVIEKAEPTQERRNVSFVLQKSNSAEMPVNIWNICWNEKDGYFDFTESVWVSLSHETQVEYARKYQEWYAKKEGKEVEKEVRVGSTRMVMVLIPPGKYWMGSPEGEASRGSDEERHQVLISKGFWIGKYEVTQKQWGEVMGNNPANFKKAGENAPVESVSWNDCQEFCKKTGLSLPTEAQWEYACRAGTLSVFNIGEDVSADRVNYNGNYPYKGSKGVYRQTTVRVGGLENKNAWGCYDFHGNVWEWCNDWYDEGYNKGSVTGVMKDPLGPNNGSLRCRRGGSWNYNVRLLRAAHRDRDSPDYSYSSGGLRGATILEKF